MSARNVWASSSLTSCDPISLSRRKKGKLENIRSCFQTTWVDTRARPPQYNLHVTGDKSGVNTSLFLFVCFLCAHPSLSPSAWTLTCSSYRLFICDYCIFNCFRDGTINYRLDMADWHDYRQWKFSYCAQHELTPSSVKDTNWTTSSEPVSQMVDWLPHSLPALLFVWSFPSFILFLFF